MNENMTRKTIPAASVSAGETQPGLPPVPWGDQEWVSGPASAASIPGPAGPVAHERLDGPVTRAPSDPDAPGYPPVPASGSGFIERLRTPVISAILGGVVLLGAGFGTGFVVGKDHGSSSAQVGPAGQNPSGQGGFGQGGFGSFGPPGGGAGLGQQGTQSQPGTVPQQGTQSQPGTVPQQGAIGSATSSGSV